MTTKLISLNQYRTNLTKLWKDAKEKNVRYVVMVHSKPVFEVTPISGKSELEWDGMDRCINGEIIPTEHDKKAYRQAMKDLENGEVYDLKDIMKAR